MTFGYSAFTPPPKSFPNDVTFDQNVTVLGSLNVNGEVSTAPSTVSAAGLNLPPGTGPSSPSNGDIWNDSGILRLKSGGFTVSLIDNTNTQVIGGEKTLSYVHLGASTLDNVGFFGATPINQPHTTGTTSGFTGGAGSTVDSAATFTGGLGSTAYTISDIVLALKQLGIIKS